MGGIRHSPVESITNARRGADTESVRRSLKRREADALFALVVLAIGTITVFALSHAGAAFTAPPRGLARPTTAATHTARTSKVLQAQVKVYPMPVPEADLMQPAVDASGHVWFGEMGTNRLGRLDSISGRVDSWAPPGGQFGIMAVAVARDGTVWFTEQSANYIGRFDPRTGAFKTYPLAVQNGRSAAPQDIAIDGAGHIWFTEVTLGAIGRLDAATGQIKTWPVPSPTLGTPIDPYGIAVSRSGAVWFSGLTGGALGHLDPASGQIRLYSTPTSDAQIFSIAVGPDERVWFTELQYGRLGTLDPQTGAIREFTVPQPISTTPNLYDVGVAPDGSVWAASMGQNAIARFEPKSSTFTLYELPDAATLPYGLCIDEAGRIWFTADRSPINYVGVLNP
jgi:virginiamycin B lyase